MYNFGVVISKDMEEKDKAYLEQNIQMAIQQKEIDLEDAIAIRQLKDVNQAERLLIVRRKKRMQRLQAQAKQNSDRQKQEAMQAAQATSQLKIKEAEMEAKFDIEKMKVKNEMESKLETMRHEFRKEIEMIKAKATLGFREEDLEFREKLEVLKEDIKDDRLSAQTSDQSKLISQRQGKREEVQKEPTKLIDKLFVE